jgi:Domain of unknown function (DUF4352)
MSRIFAALAALNLLFVGPLTVCAQDATPVTGGVSTIYAADGAEIATITVKDFVDPFVDYDPTDVPIHGYHFVMANIGVENTGERTLTANPSDFVLVDTDGFAYYPVTVDRPDQGSVSDFSNKQMSAGDMISGAIFFQVLNDATLQSLKYGVSSGLLRTGLSITESPVLEAGETVKIMDHDGSDWSEVAVTDVTDPFKGFDQSYAPDRGQHYVAINVDIKNVGPRPMRIEPSDFYLVDTLGVVFASVTFNLAESSTEKFLDFQNGLKTGASTSGIIGFLVYNDANVAVVIYSPRDDRLITVATPAKEALG